MIAVGGSLGSFKALRTLLSGLPPSLPAPVAVVLHQHKDAEMLRDSLQTCCLMPVVEVVDKELIENGHVYVGPPDYHLLVDGEHFSLCTDEPVNYARPSIDVLFESAADALGSALIGVVLTGANQDGARGAACIQSYGGIVVVQDPATAECPTMPAAALAATRTPHVLPLDRMAALLVHLVSETSTRLP